MRSIQLPHLVTQECKYELQNLLSMLQYRQRNNTSHLNRKQLGMFKWNEMNPYCILTRHMSTSHTRVYSFFVVANATCGSFVMSIATTVD